MNEPRIIITTDRHLSSEHRALLVGALEKIGFPALVLDGGMQAQAVPLSRLEMFAMHIAARLALVDYISDEARAIDARCQARALMEVLK